MLLLASDDLDEKGAGYFKKTIIYLNHHADGFGIIKRCIKRIHLIGGCEV